MRCVDVAAAAHALLAPRGPSSATYDRSLHALLHWISLPGVFWSVWEALVVLYPTQVESGQSELPVKSYCRLNICMSVCFLGQADGPVLLSGSKNGPFSFCLARYLNPVLPADTVVPPGWAGSTGQPSY